MAKKLKEVYSKYDLLCVIGIILIIVGSAKISFLPFREWDIPVFGKFNSNGIDAAGWLLLLYPFIWKYFNKQKSIDKTE